MLRNAERARQELVVIDKMSLPGYEKEARSATPASQADRLMRSGITSYTGSAYNGSNYQRWFTGAFVHGDWRALPSITVNMGLRWDFFTPYADVSGRQANFIPAGGNGPTGTHYMSSEGCQVNRSTTFDALLASNGIALNCNSNFRTGTALRTNFAPRLCFAWRNNDRFVVRGGYGITYGAVARRTGFSLIRPGSPLR